MSEEEWTRLEKERKEIEEERKRLDYEWKNMHFNDHDSYANSRSYIFQISKEQWEANKAEWKKKKELLEERDRVYKKELVAWRTENTPPAWKFQSDMKQLFGRLGMTYGNSLLEGDLSMMACCVYENQKQVEILGKKLEPMVELMKQQVEQTKEQVAQTKEQNIKLDNLAEGLSALSAARAREEGVAARLDALERENGALKEALRSLLQRRPRDTADD